MLFNSLHFLLFFPLVVGIYFLIPRKVRWVWLLAASYYYYMSWNAKYALLLAGSTAITWLSGLLIAGCGEKPNGDGLKKWVVAFSFLSNLAILFVFKYFHFGLSVLNRILRLLHISAVRSSFSVLLPVGISFYILQALSYTMDVYRGKVKVEKNPLKYALFVSFFPQLVAGPIERSQDLLPQILVPHDFDFDRVKRGLWLMLWGYFQKLVIADRLALFVNTVYGDPANYLHGGVVNLTALIFFAFQTYTDFAGYSNLALGAAEVLGFRLTTNFVRPFFSVNITEFWIRWHVSLSRWFVNYLYIPLGGNRVGTFRKYVNVLIVFLASGLWHGADWTFLVWGGLNGCISIVERLLTPLWRSFRSVLKFDDRSALMKCVQSAYVIFMFGLVQVFFRSETLTQAMDFLRGMCRFDPHDLFNGKLLNYGMDPANFVITALSLLVLFAAAWFTRDGSSLRDKLEVQPLVLRWGVIIAAIAVVILFGVYGPGFDASQFIYFQF
ncbi:MAG: MBOAT family protein [Anaerolineaceae bacterium]|nr:MBOAT family protein [Anaerolineaceae bacterium]